MKPENCFQARVSAPKNFQNRFRCNVFFQAILFSASVSQVLSLDPKENPLNQSSGGRTSEKIMNKNDCFIKLSELLQRLPISENRIVQIRRNHWIEGVHYCPHGRHFLFNWPMVHDWWLNQGNPALHQKAIERFRASLPSGQPPPENGKPPKQAGTQVKGVQKCKI
jgi:hypothetical protein